MYDVKNDILVILNEKFGDTVLSDLLKNEDIKSVSTVQDVAGYPAVQPVMKVKYKDGRKYEIKSIESIVKWVEYEISSLGPDSSK